MFTSIRRTMGNSCSDTWVVRGGLKPPIVDSPLVISLIVLSMTVLCMLCLFSRSAPAPANGNPATSTTSERLDDRAGD